MIKFFNSSIVLKSTLFSFFYFVCLVDNKCYYLIDINVWNLYYKKFKMYLCTNIVFVSNGELNKNFFFVFKVIKLFISNGITRNSVLFAIGGGVVGDIAGFISAIILRGISMINIPTTLLAQVDSSIGGKNGVNTLYGKNMLGTIKQSYYIIVILDFISTLSHKVFLFGFSELLKIMVINNPSFYKNFCNYLNIILRINIFLIVKKAINCKLCIVFSDINDTSNRLKLNFGHTFAHAIEKYSNYVIEHGMAVFIGIYIASKISFVYFSFKYKDYVTLVFLLNLFLPGIYYYAMFYYRKILCYLKFDKKNFMYCIKFVFVDTFGKVYLKSLLVC